MRIKRIVSKGLVAGAMGAAALAGTVGVASPASATTAWPSHSSYLWANGNGGWSNVRSCPSTACSVLFSVYNTGHPVYMLCYTDGQWSQGNSWTNRWFYVYVPDAGASGYVNASLVFNQASSPHC
jgi:hypothetical protein